ncbi:MAG: molybdate ABC transporter substrate-binding protein [Candidatus Bipolaricaulota bacterium]|nr:molybdate ABC transporter substrate-binding protein [Candidatus Bipolaricaulota bacterium]
MSHTRSVGWIVGTALAVLGVLYLSRSVAEPTLRVAAAADLKFALDELIEVFQRQHPQVSVAVSYGSSGSFFAQLSQRAPFDIFFSADMDYPRKLMEQGLALPETEFLYAIGRIVLWVVKDSSLSVETLGVQALLDPTVKKIALANPQHAPYGRAAETALKSLGVYNAVREKFVFGENVAQAAQFVQSGAAQVGVIALSLALAPPLREHGRFWELPPESYPKMEQGGVILRWARDRASAQLLRAFALSTQGRALLKSYGFFLPGE